MKKFIPLLFITALLFSCAPEVKTYKVTMEVFYPSRIDTISVIGESRVFPELYSHRGTNYVGNLYSTSAPIKVWSVETLK